MCVAQLYFNEWECEWEWICLENVDVDERIRSENVQCEDDARDYYWAGEKLSCISWCKVVVCTCNYKSLRMLHIVVFGFFCKMKDFYEKHHTFYIHMN